MAKTPTRKLINFVTRLRRQRRTHLRAVERIDALFAEMGISPVPEAGSAPAKRRGRPPRSVVHRKKRGKSATRRKQGPKAGKAWTWPTG